MASGEGKTVCVTGGSGYIASWLIKLLLERGYTVRATVRNLNDEYKIKHLLELDGAKERLHLFEADLLKESSFDSAIDGCDGVFHTASPCRFDCEDPQVELIDPAVKGTINVLNSCAKASSVKRVVLTSSAGAMLFNAKPISHDTMADETWFSDLQYCRDAKLWYGLAKTLAEEAAWKLAKEKGIDLITTLPGVIVGPLLQPTLNFSSGVIASLINEGGDYTNTSMVWVHVKDVAQAHVVLLESPSASGRYALVESSAYFSEVVEMIHELYPTHPLANKCEDGGLFPDVASVSKEKMKFLGMDSYIPLKEGLKDTIESLREKNLIPI